MTEHEHLKSKYPYHCSYCKKVISGKHRENKRKTEMLWEEEKIEKCI